MYRKIIGVLVTSVWFFALLLVGGAVWVAVLSPEPFELGLLFDPGFLFIVSIMFVLFFVTYLVTSRVTGGADR